jgi:hypothetical protein
MDIGKERRTILIEPIEEPAVTPSEAPAPEPAEPAEREPVPAP